MKNYMKVKFLSKNENVIFSRTVAVGFLVNLNLEISILNEIKTAISEAVTNAIVHAYPHQIGTIKIKCRILKDNTIDIIVKDQGIGIQDLAMARQPMYTTGGAERRGMG